MFNKELVREAHRMTKEVKKEYPEVNYKFQFGLSIKYLLSNKEENKMVELKGSAKQIAWAEKIRAEKVADWEKQKAYYTDKENGFDEKKVAELTASVERIFSIESASNWIDLKGHSIVALANADLKKKLNRYCFDISQEKEFKSRY